jgi:hypothetical protein
VGPASLGGVYSIGVKMGYMILPWWTLAAVAALSAVPVFWVVETEGFGGSREYQNGSGKSEDDGDGGAEDEGRDSRRNESPYQSVPRSVSKNAAASCASGDDEQQSSRTMR